MCFCCLLAFNWKAQAVMCLSPFLRSNQSLTLPLCAPEVMKNSRSIFVPITPTARALYSGPFTVATPLNVCFLIGE